MLTAFFVGFPASSQSRIIVKAEAALPGPYLTTHSETPANDRAGRNPAGIPMTGIDPAFRFDDDRPFVHTCLAHVERSNRPGRRVEKRRHAMLGRFWRT